MRSHQIPSFFNSTDLYRLARKADEANSAFSDTQVALERVESDMKELGKELRGAAGFLHDSEGDSPDGARAEANEYYRSAVQNLIEEYRPGVNLAEHLRQQAERLLEVAKKLDEIKNAVA